MVFHCVMKFALIVTGSIILQSYWVSDNVQKNPNFRLCSIEKNPLHDFIKINLTAAMMTRRFWNMLCYALDKHHQSSAARRSMIKVKPVSCNLLAKGTEVVFSYFSPISDYPKSHRIGNCINLDFTLWSMLTNLTQMMCLVLPEIDRCPK